MAKEKKVKGLKVNNLIIFLIVALIIVTTLLFSSIHTTGTSSVSLVDAKKYLDNSQAQTDITGKVTVVYTDENGNEIADKTTITGNLGDEYSVVRKNIEGYKAYGIDPINKKGNFDAEEEFVTFRYEKLIGGVNSSTDGKNVTIQVIKDKDASQYKEYKFIILTEDTEGNSLKQAEYKITNKNSSVIRNGKDYTGNYVVGSFSADTEGKDEYKVSQIKAPEGYENFDDVNIIFNKTLNSNELFINAEVLNTKDVSIDTNETNKEIILKIKNTKKQNPSDEPIIPDEPDKIFDLEINKILRNVKVITDGKTIEKNKADNKLLKIDIPKSKITSTEIIATYILEVKNVGEIPGYATEISDTLPDGMTIVNNDIWTENNGVAICNEFSNTKLNPGDSVSAEIVLSLKLTEANIGLKNNLASISGYYNDEGITDNTPDNKSEEPMLITIKTGKQALITIEVILVLGLASTLIYEVKKYIER